MAAAAQTGSVTPQGGSTPKLKPLILVEERNRSSLSIGQGAGGLLAPRRSSVASEASTSGAQHLEDEQTSSAAIRPPKNLLVARLKGQTHDNPSDQWTVPSDSEGAHVRKTYAYFDRAGIIGDGFIEGKEFTRHKSETLPWEKVKKSAHDNSPVTELGAGSLWREASRDILAPGGDDRHLSSTSSAPSAPVTTTTVDRRTSTTSVVTNDAERPEGKVAALPAQPPETSQVTGQPASAGEEVQVGALLGKIDRYGFFSSNISQRIAQGRVVSLGTEPFKKLPVKRSLKSRVQTKAPENENGADDEAGLAKRIADAAFQKRNLVERRLRGKEDTRIGKWDKMMVAQADKKQPLTRFTISGSVSARKLRRRIFKGIPDRWRAAVWEALVEQKVAAKKGKQVRRHETSAQAFMESLQVASPHDVQIDLDVPRTISGHILFHTRYGLGQRNLFHLLHAFSLLCDDCAYCQGMGPIGATLLCYLIPEVAYASMVALHDVYDLHKIFSPGFPGLVELFYIQNSLMERYMPRLKAKLDEDMITTSSYATKWYITLFNGTVPYETQLRIWDAFLFEGPDVLVITALSVLWNLQARLLHPTASFEYTLGALSSYFIPVDDDSLLLWIADCLAKQDVKQSITNARKEWALKVLSGEAQTIAL